MHIFPLWRHCLTCSYGQEVGRKNFDWLFSIIFPCSVLVDHSKLLKLNIGRKENHQELLRKQKEGRETRVHIILTLPPQGVAGFYYETKILAEMVFAGTLLLAGSREKLSTVAFSLPLVDYAKQRRNYQTKTIPSINEGCR